MRTSEFCLHPAGDTPTSCRLFDAIQSLCIPVIVSDNIELPFEGMVDYSEFSVFVAVSDALRPNWLVGYLRNYSDKQKDRLRKNMAKVQQIFEYENAFPGGVGPTPLGGAVNHIWKKVHEKLPMIKEAIVRERRKPPGVSVPLRCHCIWTFHVCMILSILYSFIILILCFNYLSIQMSYFFDKNSRKLHYIICICVLIAIKYSIFIQLCNDCAVCLFNIW